MIGSGTRVTQLVGDEGMGEFMNGDGKNQTYEAESEGEGGTEKGGNHVRASIQEVKVHVKIFRL